MAASPKQIDPDQLASLVLVRSGNDEESAAIVSADRRCEVNRRGGNLWAFLYGNFRPRRRASRRAVDQHLFMFDWHEPRILYLAMGVLLLSCADALFTLNLLTIGASEANAFMASMLEQGTDSFLASKIGLTSCSLIILVAAARRKFIGSFNVEHLLQLFLGGYVLLIGYELYMFVYVFELSLF